MRPLLTIIFILLSYLSYADTVCENRLMKLTIQKTESKSEEGKQLYLMELKNKSTNEVFYKTSLAIITSSDESSIIYRGKKNEALYEDYSRVYALHTSILKDTGTVEFMLFQAGYAVIEHTLVCLGDIEG